MRAEYDPWTQLAHLLPFLDFGCHLRSPVSQDMIYLNNCRAMRRCEMLWNSLCSLYGEDRAKTNFPASDYAHYLALAAQHAAAGQAAEPLANASQLVEELQQVVSSKPLQNFMLGSFALTW